MSFTKKTFFANFSSLKINNLKNMFLKLKSFKKNLKLEKISKISWHKIMQKTINDKLERNYFWEKL